MPRVDYHLAHMPKHLARPVVHLNGTSKDALIDGWIEADDAVCHGLSKLQDCAPNQRDYHLLPNGAEEFQLAKEQHQARVTALVNIRLELNRLIEITQDGE